MTYYLETPEDVLRAIKDEKIQMVDLRFTDVSGAWQQILVPVSETLQNRLGFDGSSTHCFDGIQENEMLVTHAPAAAFLNPFSEISTLVVICNIRDPIIGQNYTHDPRYIAQKAEAYLKKTQIGDTANFGLEFEHFVFNGLHNGQSSYYHSQEVVKDETNWSEAPHPGNILCPKQGYFSAPPAKMLQHFCTMMVTTLERIGITVEAERHELATGAQAKIKMRFATLTHTADNLMIYNFVLENVISQLGMTASFMPNPLFSDGGSGLHVYQSIWQGGQPLFAGDGYAGSSALMRHYIAGLLEHAPALLAICASRVSHYRRLMPEDSPVKLGHAQRDSSAGSRIPINSPNPHAKRVDFHYIDTLYNPYFAFAAMLMAGIDGFHNRLYSIDPDEPIEKLYDLPPQDPTKILSAPSSLNEPLDPPELDDDFLLQGDVFTPNVIEILRLRPHRESLTAQKMVKPSFGRLYG
jgi:glutamine synthetase